jgi:hypothetical protein
MTQRKITICGKEIDIFYCAATETGFETLEPDKPVGIFWPTFKQNEQGETVLDQMPTAKTGDYLYLAIAGIVAADTYYDRKGIDTNDILFNATPEERNLLVQTIAELRDERYGIPKVVADAVAKENKTADAQAKN